MKKLCLVLALWLVPALAAPGCVANNESLLITGVALVSAETGCRTDPGTTVFRPRGVLDLNVARRFILSPILENQMTSSVNALNRQTEGRTAIVEGMITSYRVQSNRVSIAPRYFPTFGTVAPGATLGMAIEIMDQTVVDLIRGDPSITADRPATLFVNVKADARLADGQKMNSSEIAYPILVCRGCLRDCSIDPARNTFCIAGQDEPIDCALYDQLRR